MKFTTGLITGIAIGAVGAVVYSVRSGRDLRESFEQVRAEIERRDAEVLGGRLAEVTAQVEERIGEVRAAAAPALEEASAQLENARTVATDAYDRARGKADAEVADATDAVAADGSTSDVDLAAVVDEAIATGEETAGDGGTSVADAVADGGAAVTDAADEWSADRA
jgi:gas vesicle protein